MPPSVLAVLAVCCLTATVLCLAGWVQVVALRVPEAAGAHPGRQRAAAPGLGQYLLQGQQQRIEGQAQVSGGSGCIRNLALLMAGALSSSPWCL